MSLGTFTFTGRIYPERYNWGYSEPHKLKVHIRKPGRADALVLLLTIVMTSSQVTAVVETDADEDVLELRQSVRSIVQTLADAIGFMYDTPLSVDLHTSVDPAGETVIWSPTFAGLTDGEPTGDVGLLLAAMTEQPAVVPTAYREFARAIDAAGDTPLHCYRAIEAVRQAFLPAEAADEKAARKSSWSGLREALDVDLEELRWLESVAIASRHADVIHSQLSSDDRARALRLARRVISNFVSYIIDRRS